jgi:hypothetical protein
LQWISWREDKAGLPVHNGVQPPKKPEQIPRTAAHTATGSVSTNDLEERVESNIERIN